MLGIAHEGKFIYLMDGERVMDKKNSYIELCRFVASIIIVMYHTGGLAQNGENLFGGGGYLLNIFFYSQGILRCEI